MGGGSALCPKFGQFSPFSVLNPIESYVSKDKNLRFRLHPGLPFQGPVRHHGHVRPLGSYTFQAMSTLLAAVKVSHKRVQEPIRASFGLWSVSRKAVSPV